MRFLLLGGISHSPRVLKPQEDDCYGPKSVPQIPLILPKEGLQPTCGFCLGYSILKPLD